MIEWFRFVIIPIYNKKLREGFRAEKTANQPCWEGWIASQKNENSGFLHNTYFFLSPQIPMQHGFNGFSKFEFPKKKEWKKFNKHTIKAWNSA